MVQLAASPNNSMMSASVYGQPIMANAMPSSQPQITLAPGQQAPPPGQLIALPPGAMPPPGATVLIPIQTPQGVQYVQAVPAPPGMVPGQPTQSNQPVTAMPSGVYPGQARPAPVRNFWLSFADI